MKIFKFLIIIFAFSFLLFHFPVRADEYDELGKKIETLRKSLEMSQAATTPLESTLTKLEKDLSVIREEIAVLSTELKKKEKQVAENEELLEFQQKVLKIRIHSLYKSMYKVSNLKYQILLGKNLTFNIRLFGYQKSMIDDDKETIVDIVLNIKDLEEKKRNLENEKIRLAGLKKETDSQAEFFRKEIKGAKKYQAELSTKIAELTARQKQLLAQKTELFSTSVGDVPLADDPASRPDYNPGFSPAFAAFSFGAPHFKGMSQYGAYGRAKSGQNAEDILKAYYGGGVEIKKDYDTNIRINVTGYGSVDIETYAKRIYEMPGSWGDNGGMEALKAQAVAARSYALARTNNGAGSICATESCQVYKPQNKGGKWEEAVNQTRGWVLIANGKPFSAWYASTSGGYQESYSYNGYSTPGFWDTKNGRNGWTSEAYEKIGGSPWFYKSWYKTRSGKNCNRSHPWLNQEEFADIINALLVYSNGGDASGIFPIDVNSCFASNDKPWSHSRMAQEADKYGGRITSVSNISVQYASNGITAKIEVSTNRGTLNFNGKDFYKTFNLRAPGAIHLKSGLFNIEKK